MWRFRNFYSGDACHPNYSKHSLKNHFPHCAHFLYQIYSVLKLFEIAVCFAHLGFKKKFYSGDAHYANSSKHSLKNHSQHCAHYVYQIYRFFETFPNCSLFCTLWLLQNFYSGDAHYANSSKHSLKNHSQHCAHCLYQIYSVLKLFEIAVCFLYFAFYEISAPVMWHHANYGELCINHHFQHCAHFVFQNYSDLNLFEIAVCFAPFGFYEISTAVMPTMLTMVNFVQIIISNIAHTVCIRFTLFSNSSK